MRRLIATLSALVTALAIALPAHAAKEEASAGAFSMNATVRLTCFPCAGVVTSLVGFITTFAPEALVDEGPPGSATLDLEDIDHVEEISLGTGGITYNQGSCLDSSWHGNIRIVGESEEYTLDLQQVGAIAPVIIVRDEAHSAPEDNVTEILSGVVAVVPGGSVDLLDRCQGVGAGNAATVSLLGGGLIAEA
jgi:hypothetical protein